MVVYRQAGLRRASRNDVLVIHIIYDMNDGMNWSVETLNDDVDSEIEELPPALQARLIRLMEMIEKVGLEKMGSPHAEHLDGKLWELRAKAPGGIARALYVAWTGRRVIILHVFAKKTQKTPRRALELARKRLEELS